MITITIQNRPLTSIRIRSRFWSWVTPSLSAIQSPGAINIHRMASRILRIPFFSKSRGGERGALDRLLHKQENAGASLATATNPWPRGNASELRGTAGGRLQSPGRLAPQLVQDMQPFADLAATQGASLARRAAMQARQSLVRRSFGPQMMEGSGLVSVALSF